MTHPLVQLHRCGLFTSLVQTGNIIWTFPKEERGVRKLTLSRLPPSFSLPLPPTPALVVQLWTSHRTRHSESSGRTAARTQHSESNSRTAARIKEWAVGAPGQMRLSPAASGLVTGVQLSS